jgi:hypothetical protein
MHKPVKDVRAKTFHGPPAPAQAGGQPQDFIPGPKAERERLRGAAREYVTGRRAVPPFSVEELRQHSDAVLAATGAPEKYRKFIAVLLSNEAWRPAVAAVPPAQRLLLLPKCLRSERECAGTFDELGLVCGECGRCPICDLKTGAERLGYVVLVAEGAPAVMALIQSRKIEAVVGVSCLAALEAIYPLMESAAVPGIAIPLLYSGCVNTAVDIDWVWEAVRLSSTDREPAYGGCARVGLEDMRGEVDGWFSFDSLATFMGPARSETERIARTWLAKSGKRWRPFLVACTFQAFRQDPEAPLPEDLRKIAIAVECFHKA